MTTAGAGNPYLQTYAPHSSSWNTGSPELSDVKGLWNDVADGHGAVATVFDAGGFALDVLGDIGDPLGAVISCAVGWIVEHVSFLREPVDWLAGDPVSIDAAVATWNNVGAGMKSVAQEYVTALNTLTPEQWSGEAATAYRAQAAQWVDALDRAGTAAELEGVLIAATGGLCAAFRGEIFTEISKAIEHWVMVGLVALANSAWTFGASIAGWVIDVEISAGLLAARISTKIAQLIGKIGRIAQTLGHDGGKLDDIGTKLVALSERMMHEVRSSRSLLGWDRRRSNLDRSRHAVDDGRHLRESVHGAKDLLHLDGAKTALHLGKTAARAVDDPGVDDLDEVARTGGDLIGKEIADKVRHPRGDGS